MGLDGHYTCRVTLESDSLVLGGYEERVVFWAVSGVIAAWYTTMNGIMGKVGYMVCVVSEMDRHGIGMDDILWEC